VVQEFHEYIHIYIDSLNKKRIRIRKKKIRVEQRKKESRSKIDLHLNIK